jgi:hypothetical protein
MLVNWIGVTITDAKGHVTYSNAFVTSLPVTRDTVAEIVACARARWKIESVLQTHTERKFAMNG